MTLPGTAAVRQDPFKVDADQNDSRQVRIPVFSWNSSMFCPARNKIPQKFNGDIGPNLEEGPCLCTRARGLMKSEFGPEVKINPHNFVSRSPEECKNPVFPMPSCAHCCPGPPILDKLPQIKSGDPQTRTSRACGLAAASCVPSPAGVRIENRGRAVE